MQISGTAANYATGARPQRSPGPNALESLTDEDRAFIAASTGVALTADSIAAPAAAFDIAYDRQAGILTGQIDRSYLDSVLFRSEASVAEQTNDLGHGSNDAIESSRDYYQQWWRAAVVALGEDTSSVDLDL
ncbi:hypothetical protein ACGIF2_07550 [Cellulomonas sp. P22]|uniref:hypothetical protein n=1 Tax=Cellulomonas sp. P22 TaxID=3373189 RepID=UPI0037AC6C32